MLNEKEKFLQAEEAATKLVDTLAQLKDQIIEYNTIVKELDEIKNSFIRFINSMENIAINSLESLEVLKSIGGPEIFEKLNTITSVIRILRDELHTFNDQLANLINEVDEKNKNYLENVVESLNQSLSDNFRQLFDLIINLQTNFSLKTEEIYETQKGNFEKVLITIKNNSNDINQKLLSIMKDYNKHKVSQYFLFVIIIVIQIYLLLKL